jgi:hypothetical protein
MTSPVPHDDGELRWRSVGAVAFEALADRLRAPRLLERLPGA